MSILDIVALHQAREIMLRWFDSTPKFPEEDPVDWALFERNTKAVAGRIIEQ